jgi:hypothetical protein
LADEIAMRAISNRLRKLELRRIEKTPVGPAGDAKRMLLEKINKIRERLDAARDCGEDTPPVDTEAVMAVWRARIAEYGKRG